MPRTARVRMRALGIALLVVLACGPALTGCRSGEMRDQPADAPLEHVRIAVSEERLSALVFLAEHQGLYERHGLEVEIVRYSSSTQAMDALRAGSADAAAVADVPIASAAYEGYTPQLIATVGRSQDDVWLVARRDSGIAEPGDLVGKRICTQKGTAAEFFLHALLARHGLDESYVEIVHDTYDAAVTGVASGAYDAAALRSPHCGTLVEALGLGGIVFSEPGLYVKTMNLCVAGSMEHGTRVALLRALIDAEPSDDPETAKERARDLAEAFGGVSMACDERLSEAHLVRLDQSLLLGLEDAARWMISGDAEGSARVPDFLGQLDLSALDEIDPERISVIR